MQPSTAAVWAPQRRQSSCFLPLYPSQKKQFFDQSARVARRIDVAALGEGVLVYSSQPTADGYAADQTLLAPSFLTTDADWEEICRRLRQAIERVAAEVNAGEPMALIVG